MLRVFVVWFQFHSSFWPNLHHFLYQRVADTAQMTPAERKTWRVAQAYYDSAFAGRAIDHDSALIDVNYALADADSAPLVASPALPAPLVAALTAAAPIYRRHFWARHDSANRAWIASMRAELAEHGDGLVAQLERVYHVPFPPAPVRVEVVAYANWAGAYTTVNPTLVTMASLYVNHRGSLGLEQLVHEPSHAMMDSVDAALHSLQDRREVEHAIIFYTAGELVRQRIPSHTPFADVRGLWTPGRSPLAKYYTTVVPIWREYLDGHISFHDALARIIAARS